MIVSASRRTDIPAFYSDWFFNRLKEGYVMVRNPMNYHQVSKIYLNPDVVDCIVFWTKNPREMLDKLHLLKNHKYYFQFTLNSYDKEVEVNVPKKTDLIQTFIQLSETIGKNKVIWRYDPIFLTRKINTDYHYKYFEYLAEKLNKYTKKCVISFLDLYRNSKRNLKAVELLLMADKEIKEIASNLVGIARRYNLQLESCAEVIDLSDIGIQRGKCIDDKLVSEIVGAQINIDKDTTQREVCGCIASVDIGSYNTCKHNCLYCYANYSSKIANKNYTLHNAYSPFLFGDSEIDDKVNTRKMSSCVMVQRDLFTE